MSSFVSRSGPAYGHPPASPLSGPDQSLLIGGDNQLSAVTSTYFHHRSMDVCANCQGTEN